MRIIETKDIPIDRIIKNPFQSRFDKVKLEEQGIDKQKIKKHEETKQETIEAMAISFEKSGLLNSVIVREYNGKYQLVAGDLRIQAFKIADKKEISAKIIDVSDQEARIIGFVENYHRQDLMDIEKEENLYNIWIDGKELFYNKKSEMSRWLGIKYDKLLLILSAAEERHKEKSKPEKEQSRAIISATAKDLNMTRQLEKIDSDARKELLKAKNEKKISSLELERSVKAIKDASDNDVPKEVLTGIVKLISEKKLVPKNAEDFVKTIAQIPKEEQKDFVDAIKKQEKLDIYDLRPVARAIKDASDNDAPKEVLTGIVNLFSEKKLAPQNAEDFVKTITQIPKEEQKELVETIGQQEKVDIDEVKNFVNTYNAVPPDIQKKMMEKKIGIEEAKVVSKFRTKEAREQILEERKIIVEMKDKEKDKELNEHTNVRNEQEKEVEQFGNRKPGHLTKMDIGNGLKEFYNSPEQIDKRAIERYRDIMFKTELYQPSTFKNIHLDKSKKAIIEILWHIYEHWYSYLVEIGEIKIVGHLDIKTNPVPPKRLYG